MTTNYHTPIAAGASNDPSTVNTPLSALDTQITANANGSAGGGSVTDQLLKDWVEGGNYELTAATYDATYYTVISTATVKWPDGSGGTFTAVTINSTWWVIDKYTVSHTDSGKTVTQDTMTRDSNGMVTAKPALTVA